MAYQSNLLGDFWRSYRQKRIGGGAPSRREMGGLLGPMLEYDARKAKEAADRAQIQSNNDREYALRADAAKTAKFGQIVGGVSQLAQLPMAYKTGKKLYDEWYPASKPPPTVDPNTTNLLGTTTPDPGPGFGAVDAVGTTAQGSVNLMTDTAAPASDAAVSSAPATTAPTSTAGGVTGSAAGNAGAGAAVGAGAQYAVTQTDAGRTSNADVANLSRDWLGMTDLTNEEYASKGSTVAGGATGGGGYGAAAGAIIWDVAHLFQTGKVTNELLGIPFADRLF